MRTVFASILLAGLIVAAGCGGGSASTSGKTTTPGGGGNGSNVLAIAVSGGPLANQQNGGVYPNGAFASAKICAPGSTSNCVTINNLLVDTGSYGLRVFDSEVSSLNLPAVNAANGSAAYDCVSFVDGSFMWGQVQKADVTLGGETASGLPIQVISGSSSGVPTSCSNGGTNANTVQALGSNGILGVGSEPTDCFYQGVSVCDPSSGAGNPPFPAYYTCSGSSCSPAFIAKANQVTNPVVLFANDNNGVIVELPSVSGSQATLSGSLIFGIGTESNNQLPSRATVFTTACEEFTTIFNGTSYSPDASNCNSTSASNQGSFIDSGSNFIFFPDSNIAQCSSNSGLSGFYCPAATQNLSATNKGENGASKSASFTVANAQDVLNSSGSDAVLPTVAGVNPSGFGFDWGLPFFYGVNVYSSIDGQSVPSGAPAAPWWAY